MQYLVTGVDATGRSCVLNQASAGGSVETMGQRLVYASEVDPPPPRPTGHAEDLELGVTPGLAKWMIVEWPPNMETLYHHTDTVDFDTVLEGRIALILDDGEHPLEVGDCVLVQGVDHSWRVGPEGCTTSVVLLGSTRTG